MRYGHSSSQFEWDSYVSNIVECANLSSYYADIEMDDITFDGYEEIDKLSLEQSEVA